MNISDSPPIIFGSQFAFKSVKTGKFLSLEKDKATLNANAAHPLVYVNPPNLPSRQTFSIYFLQQHTNTTDPIKYGSSIYIKSLEGKFLSIDKDGNPICEKCETKAFNVVSMTKIIKWKIEDPDNLGNQSTIKIGSFVKFIHISTNILNVDLSGKVISALGLPKEDCKFQVFSAQVFPLPSFVYKIRYTHSINLSQIDPASKRKNLSKLTMEGMDLKEQEQQLVEDILFVLQSLEGTFIKKKDNKYCVEPWRESPSCDSSLHYQVNKILPLSYDQEYIRAFSVNRFGFEWGNIIHSLNEALKTIIQEYDLQLLNLDNEFRKGQLTLQKLWYGIQPTLKSFETLRLTLEEIKDIKGGHLLSVIWKILSLTSDSTTKTILNYLFRAASKPYIEILSKWIIEGKVNDPFNEFMILDKTEFDKSYLESDFSESYWSSKFTINENMNPRFLHSQTSKILLIGKYMHIIKDCSVQAKMPITKEEFLEIIKCSSFVDSTIECREINELVEKAYQWASKTIQKVLFEDEKLLLRLETLKRFFLISKGDFLQNFLESLSDTRLLNNPKFDHSKLEPIFELSVRTSSAALDLFKDDITCQFQKITIVQQIFSLQAIKSISQNQSGIQKNPINDPLIYGFKQDNLKVEEGFCLFFKVKWPLNIILSTRAISKYQLIFRHLFYLKFIEKELLENWKIHQSFKNLSDIVALKPHFILLNKMIHFVKSYLNHLTVEVIEQKWHKFVEKIRNVGSLDDLLGIHNQFLDEILSESFLTDQNKFKIIMRTLHNCAFFAMSNGKFLSKIEEDSGLNQEDKLLSEAYTSKIQQIMDKKKESC